MSARFVGLKPASAGASRAASASSSKLNTRPELALRLALRRLGLRGYRVDDATIAGRPDVVFRIARVAVFCDGDFWHGRDISSRLQKLKGGHNASYWVEKISGNVARDRHRTGELEAAGWTVLRFWESDILSDPDEIAMRVRDVVLANRDRLNVGRVRRKRRAD
jgi:DNA mismatch endonuclease (patch repair protein)